MSFGISFLQISLIIDLSISVWTRVFSVFRSTGLSATIVGKHRRLPITKIGDYMSTRPAPILCHSMTLLLANCRSLKSEDRFPRRGTVSTNYHWLILPHDHCSTPRSEMADHHCPPLLANSIVFDGSTIMLVKSQSWVLNPILRPPSIQNCHHILWIALLMLSIVCD